jgi:hypothetical protein
MKDYDYDFIENVKIDEEAPIFELHAYNPKTDNEEKVSLESLK